MVDQIKNYITRPAGRQEAIVGIEESILNSTRVCCFYSGDIKNPLMWAHYANNHQGFCVEYEYSPSFNSQIHSVNYTNNWRNPSARELALCPDETMVRILTTKDTCWHYENEFRHVHFDLSSTISENEKGKAIIIPPCLQAKKIITGINFKQDELPKFKAIKLPKISFRDL